MNSHKYSIMISEMTNHHFGSQNFFSAYMKLVIFNEAFMKKQVKKRKQSAKDIRRLKKAGAELMVIDGPLWKVPGDSAWYPRAEAIQNLDRMEKNSKRKNY